ncbi:hypothetical protein [Halomonas sp. ND22Bw]|uniref:hypothetical protein n=1 Tax=Halomonas sp. ND22Bw TaxID=2054178 RepID=UPI0011B239AA
MWFVRPKRNYLPEIPWQRLDEPEVMSWQIRVRDYDTMVANIIFFSVMASQAVFFYYLLAVEREFVFDWATKGFLLLFLSFFPIGMSMTHQTSINAYRLTNKGYERVSWKPQIDTVKPVMKWTAIVSGIAVVIAALFNPYFLVGAVGPAGFGLIALCVGNSKEYHSMVRAERHENRSWDSIEEIVLWKKRRLIGLKMTFDKNHGGGTYSMYQKLYCKKGEVEKVLDFVKSVTSDIEFIERKLVVNSVSAE